MSFNKSKYYTIAIFYLFKQQTSQKKQTNNNQMWCIKEKDFV